MKDAKAKAKRRVRDEMSLLTDAKVRRVELGDCPLSLQSNTGHSSCWLWNIVGSSGVLPVLEQGMMAS